MGKRTIIISILHTFSAICYAQISVGIKAGYSNNHFNTDISNRKFTEHKNGSSAGFGILVNWKINNRIGIESSIELLKKKYSFVRTGVYAGVVESFTNSYLQIPVIIQVRTVEKWKVKVFINSGVYVGYWAFSKMKGAIPNLYNNIDDRIDNNGQSIQLIQLTPYSEKYNFSKRKDNRFEFGWILGITLKRQLNKNYSAFFEGNYYQALTNQQKKYMINQAPRYNETFFASIGCLFNIDKK